MRFSDAVRHLESMGLVVKTATAKSRVKFKPVGQPKKSSLGRKAGSSPMAKVQPRTIVPVKIFKDGTLGKKPLTAIRKSRAELRNSVPKRPRR